MSVPQRFLPKARAERMIAVARLALATCSMLTFSIDPALPVRLEGAGRALTIGYTVWAVAVAALLISKSTLLPRHWQLATHAVDLLASLLIMNLTAGMESPFFLFLVFALTAATLRWDAPGALWTGGAVLLVFFGTVLIESLRGTPVAVSAFVIRTTYLVVLALMLGYLGRYGADVHGITQRLRTWQPAVGRGFASVMEEAVQHIAAVLGAPRAVVVWEEPEEPDLRMTWWADGRVSTSREDPVAFQPLVAPPFAGTDFFCRDASTPGSTIVFTSADGLKTAPGPAVHPRFVEHFAIRTLLEVDCGLGRLFVIDKAHLTVDDLWLAQIVARQISSAMTQASLVQRLEETRVLETRARVARDLHDGVLQSLTAITLRLQAIGRAVDTETRRRIESLQVTISDEARRLRGFIQDLTLPEPVMATDSLSDRLETLGQHIERDWGLRVELDMRDLAWIPSGLAHDVYFIVREALINVARHAGASVARASIAVEGTGLQITVGDDGHGFPFDGRHEGSTLAATKRAPRMLYDRVTSLGGRLVVDSGPKGSRIDIHVPLPAAEPR